MAVKTSFRYAGQRARNRPVEVAVAGVASDWAGDFGERNDREHELVWGPQSPLARLLDQPPRDDERDWFDDPSRFGVLARRLWTPLLAAERIDES
jgi:exodeoxyribonuclease V gamma subunit